MIVTASTFDDPGVYMRSTRISPLPRGACWQEQRSCCTPFGAEYGENLTAGYIPSDGCSHTFYSIQIEAASSELTEESITLEMYPEGFDLETTVAYSITGYGVVNSSELESLSWFDGNTTKNGSNELNMYLYPPGMGSTYSGSVVVAEGETQSEIPLNVTSESITCDADEECVTYEECTGNSLVFAVELTSCNTSDSGYGSCSPLYPYVVWVAVTRSTDLCAIIYGLGNSEDDLPPWFWWVLIALLVFMLIMAYLIYRFWWKQKKTATELGDAEDELDQQKADNEAGFGKDLDVGDVAFNPMATGVPGMERPADVFGNELQQRQMQAHNDMVDVQAEVFQVRQDYGQVATGPRGGY